MDEIKPIFDKNCIPVVFSSDEGYAPYLSVALISLRENASKEHSYDLIVLDGGLSEKTKNTFLDIFAGKENFSLRFVKATIDPDLEMRLKKTTRNHQSIETYYRLFVPNILYAYDKCIYLDVDIVINCNLLALYYCDLSEHILAAVKDEGVGGGCNRKDNDVLVYTSKTLRMENGHNYFNAGVLVLNLKRMRDIGFYEMILDVLRKIPSPPRHDQSILNSIIDGDYYKLGYTYNVQWFFSKNERVHFTKEMDLATKNPSIIHYITDKKPWNYRLNHLADYFWKYAQYSPYYEEILCAYKKAFFEENLRNKKLYKKYRIRTLFSFGLFPRWKRKMKLYAERIDHLCF